jgi:hypothetical protein
VIERLYRMVGWVCVGMGACVPLGSIWRFYRGETIPWWEPLLVVALGGLLVLFGLLYALPNAGTRFKIVFASAWGAFALSFGVVALLLPAEVLVTHGRGPRSIFTAQLRGVYLLLVGGGFIGWAVVNVVRQRRQRTAAPDAPSR